MGIFKRFISRQKEDISKKEAKRQELFLKVKELLAKELKIDDLEKIQPTSKLREDLNIDSLNSIELIMAFEDTFSIDVPDEDAEKMLFVKDIVDYINTKDRNRK